MGWVPVSNEELPKLATPFVPTATAPSVVAPSLKVTVPVGGIPLCNAETVAVKVMGCPRRAMSVVDGYLKVYGIDNLRIADGPIMPRVTAGNTMAACVIIGERAGEILKADHKLS